MSKCAYCVYRPYRCRPAPIRAAYVPCRCNVRFCLQGRREIWPFRPATDLLGNGIAWTTGLIVNSCHRATIQIPIATRPSMTTAKHPAVSSLEAYPTPAP